VEPFTPGLGIETASFFGKKDTVESPTQTFFGVYGEEFWGSPKTVLRFVYCVRSI